jgi:hypothetical protein
MRGAVLGVSHLLLALRPLDALHVSKHRLLLDESAAKAVGVEGAEVEAGEGDKLPSEAKLSEVLAEGVDLLVGHAARVPVEGGGEVVGEVGLLAWAVDSLDTLGELHGVGKLRIATHTAPRYIYMLRTQGCISIDAAAG